MKKGKELKIDTFKNYNIVYGSVNNKNPKALYINVSTWAEPRYDDKINYTRVIKDIDKRIRQTLYNNFYINISTPFIKERTIIDLDIRESGVRYGKRSFTNCEITLFMKYEIPANSEILKPCVNQIIEEVIKSSFENNRNFKFYKKKR